MRIAICDDKAEQIALISASLKAYFERKPQSGYELSSFSKPSSFLFEQEKKPFDLVLLDICMPEVLGTDIAKEIRKRKERTEIIFITTSDEFAVEAFSMKAAHYLVKPFAQNEFSEAMDRAIEMANKKEDKILTVKEAEGYTTIPLSEVLYVESDSHVLTIHCASEDINSRMNLNDFLIEASKLKPGLFIAPVKGFVINLSHVKTLKAEEIIMSNGRAISISQRLRKEVKNAFFDYRFSEDNHG